MNDAPRPRGEPVLPGPRLARIIAYGVTMMVGTLGVLYVTLQHGDPDQAPTLAFTTFVLFQFFNVFNARVEERSAFNEGFFRNRMLWWSLAGALCLQVLAVEWGPAQAIFGTSELTLGQWAAAIGVASLILIAEEARKALWRQLASRNNERT